MAYLKILMMSILLFFVPFGRTQSTPSFYVNVTIDYDKSEEFISLLQAESKLFNCTIHEYDGDKNVALFLRSSDETIFSVNMEDDAIAYIIEPEAPLPFTFQFEISGLFVGIENIHVMASEEARDYHISNSGGARSVTSEVVKVLLYKSTFANIVLYMIYAVLCLWFFLLGATLDVESVLERVKKPWAVIVGIICQFTLMPPLALGFAFLFNLDNAAALGLLLIGTCPGGNLSNTLSVMLDLDYALSVTMTCCTNLLALGMMPLNIFIYARFFTSENDSLSIPYIQLILQLLLILSPFIIGIFIARKFEKFKEFCQKWIKFIATTTLIIVFACDLPFRIYVFRSSWQIYLSAISLPLVGTLLGTIVAKLVCVETKSALTIGLETGIQNALLAAGILLLFYPSPEGDLAVRAAYLCVITATVVGFVTALLNFIVQKVRGHRDDVDEKKETKTEMNGNKVELGKVPKEDTPDKVVQNKNCDEDHYYIQPDSGAIAGVDNPAFKVD